MNVKKQKLNQFMYFTVFNFLNFSIKLHPYKEATNLECLQNNLKAFFH
jgi:hypothetical protein